MAIFIIGAQKLNNERHFRLYNTKVSENNVRDISEKDLMYLMRGNSNFKVQNAEVKDGKIVGTTGSLNKIENGVCITVIGAINENGELAGYRFVDTTGKVYNMKTPDAVQFLSGKPIQNASVVNGSYIRGINWEIPVIEDKSSKDNTNGNNKTKPIYLHIDVQHMNYKFSKDMTAPVQKYLPEEFVDKNQFLVYIEGLVYTAYVPNEIVNQFKTLVRERMRVHCPNFGKGETMTTLQIPYVKKGFGFEIETLKGIAEECGAALEVTLKRGGKDNYFDTISYYENEIWNIIEDAKDKGMKLKKYFFLGNDSLVVKNMQGALLDYTFDLSRQIQKICESMSLKYTFNYNKGKAEGKIKILDYAPLESCPYGCILVEMEER